MTFQDSLNRIEVLLRGLKDKDPAAQKAWQAVVVPNPREIRVGIYFAPDGMVARDISDWTEGAVRGLLIQVAEDMGVLDDWARRVRRTYEFGDINSIWHANWETAPAALEATLEAKSGCR